jgi:hypothetical protein
VRNAPILATLVGLRAAGLAEHNAFWVLRKPVLGAQRQREYDAKKQSHHRDVSHRGFLIRRSLIRIDLPLRCAEVFLARASHKILLSHPAWALMRINLIPLEYSIARKKRPPEVTLCP